MIILLQVLKRLTRTRSTKMARTTSETDDDCITMSDSKKTFQDLGLDQSILSILDKKQIISPTAIQTSGIPFGIKGEDVLGVAKTGTGKTLAFVLPILHELYTKQLQGTATALILTPTRELAQQIQESVQWFEKELRIYSTVIVGGVKMGRQIQAIKRKPHIVIATPGRLIDLLQQKEIDLRNTKHIVLDEADRMLDMGFAPQIQQILKYAPARDQRQMMLFSATMPDQILKLMQEYMKNPVHIEVAAPGTTAETIEQEILVLDREHRKDALLELIKTSTGAIIVFMRTKHHAKKLTQWLRQQNYKAEEIHGNRSQMQRNKAIEAIQSGRSRILVATDIAARGIDIPHLEMVVNFDLPDEPDNYVHRIGRTGRAKREGYAISFVCTDQADELQAIQKLINQQLTHTTLPNVPAATLKPSTGKKKKSGGGGRSGGGRNRGRSRSSAGSGGGGHRRRSQAGNGSSGRSGNNRSRNSSRGRGSRSN